MEPEASLAIRDQRLPLCHLKPFYKVQTEIKKSQKVAQEIATDVSKFLKFASGEVALPNWKRLLDHDIIIAYLDKCKRFKIQADGRISKLDALDAALTFLRH